MRIGSLFSGIGGLELGLERAGVGHTVWQVEQSEFCRGVLARHWPDAKRYTDVRVFEPPPVELVCGGFPCQDLSTAGRKAGISGERSGLWQEMCRIIAAACPTWVVIENIHHAWRRWVPVVRRDLFALGLASVPLRLSAADVGAWHRRRRVFILAHSDSTKLRLLARRWGGASRQAAPESEHPSRWPGPPRIDRAADGLPDRLERNRALGNAVAPQVAEVVGRALLAIHTQLERP